MNGSQGKNERLQREIVKLEVKLEPYWGVDTEELSEERMKKQLKLISEIERLHNELLQEQQEEELEAFAIKNGRLIEDAEGLHDRLERRPE